MRRNLQNNTYIIALNQRSANYISVLLGECIIINEKKYYLNRISNVRKNIFDTNQLRKTELSFMHYLTILALAKQDFYESVHSKFLIEGGKLAHNTFS